MRFKIDFGDSYAFPFGLFVRTPALFGLASRWERIEKFETREKAIAFYESVKDLPKYLD